MQETISPYWLLIVDKVLGVRESSAGYMITIEEFFAGVSGNPTMSDLVRHAADLQNNLELRPPKHMIRSAMTAARAISLYPNSVPAIHASDIVDVSVELDEMMTNYRGLVEPNLNLTEKSFYGTKFAASICSVFLSADKLASSLHAERSGTDAHEDEDISRARKVAGSTLSDIESVHVGIRDKLREAFGQKF